MVADLVTLYVVWNGDAGACSEDLVTKFGSTSMMNKMLELRIHRANAYWYRQNFFFT